MPNDPTLKSDCDLIQKALKRWKAHTQSHKWGGLTAEYQEAIAALAALERLREQTDQNSSS